MKKNFGLILISLYTLLFFIVLNIFSENDRYNIYSGFGFNDQYDNASIYFQDPLQEDEKLEVIKIVDDITRDNEVAVIVRNYIDEDDQVVGVKNYVSGKDHFISEMLPKSIALEKTFDEGNQYVSNALEENEDKVDLFTFYKGLTYEVIPFHYLEENLDALKYDLTFHFNVKDKKLVESIIKKEFFDLNITIGTMSSNSYDRNEELEKSILFISVIAFIIFVLFILFTISYKIKEVAILKLNGFTMIDILSYIFKSSILSSAILALLVPMFLSAFVFRTLNSRIVEFDFINIIVGFILVLIFIGLIVLSTIVISKYRLSDFVKNKNMNSALTNITYVLLILSAVVVLPMIQKPMSELMETVKAYTEVKINAKKIDHVHQLRFNQESRGWEFDQFDQLNNEPNENNQRQIELYDDLDEMNAIYHFRSTVLVPESVDFEKQEENLYSAYTINKKYFEESIFSINGESIEIEDNNRLSVLMDVQTFESHEWQKNDLIGNDVEADIYIFDSIDYLNFENEKNEGYKNEEAPIFLYTENESLFMKNPSDGGFYIDGRKMDKVDKYMSSEDLKNEIELYNLNDRGDLYTEGLFITLRETGIEILPGLISLFAAFISFTNFHSLEKNREIKILKSLGYKTLIISKKYISEVIVVNVIFILYLLFVRNDMDFSLVLYLLILSILMVLIYIQKVSQARINKI